LTLLTLCDPGGGGKKKREKKKREGRGDEIKKVLSASLKRTISLGSCSRGVVQDRKEGREKREEKREKSKLKTARPNQFPRTPVPWGGTVRKGGKRKGKRRAKRENAKK